MIKKYLSFALICLLLVTANFLIISAQTNTDRDAASVAKIKDAVEERGIGTNKRVELRMLDGAKLKGSVKQAGEDSFTFIDAKTKQETEIAYSDVEKVKKRMSKGNKIALGIAIGAGAAAAIVLVSIIGIRCRNEGGC